jgi:hypothetical protein
LRNHNPTATVTEKEAALITVAKITEKEVTLRTLTDRNFAVGFMLTKVINIQNVCRSSWNQGLSHWKTLESHPMKRTGVQLPLEIPMIMVVEEAAEEDEVAVEGDQVVVVRDVEP